MGDPCAGPEFHRSRRVCHRDFLDWCVPPNGLIPCMTPNPSPGSAQCPPPPGKAFFFPPAMADIGLEAGTNGTNGCQWGPEAPDFWCLTRGYADHRHFQEATPQSGAPLPWWALCGRKKKRGFNDWLVLWEWLTGSFFSGKMIRPRGLIGGVCHLPHDIRKGACFLIGFSSRIKWKMLCKRLCFCFCRYQNQKATKISRGMLKSNKYLNYANMLNIRSLHQNTAYM
jgi:hypothetical protein